MQMLRLGTDKNVFLGRQMFFSVFFLFIAFFCSFVCVFVLSSGVWGFRESLLDWHPAPICCAPAARRLGPEICPLPMHDAIIVHSVSSSSALRFWHTRS
jgi:hypothetical protein